MCDTLVLVPEQGPVWFGKNSDREPSEAQLVEHRPREAHPPGARLRATWIELPQVPETWEVVLSRPAWMWGAEMGMNEHGLAVGNEAVFTRLPVEKRGLLGMDLLRLALERAKTAEEALDLVIELLARHGQGGPCGHKNKNFTYHNSFLFADPTGAWVLETAGPFWAAERVRGARSISNALSIGEGYDRLAPGTEDAARRLGFLPKGRSFDFRAAFSDPLISRLSGAEARAACTLRGLQRGVAGPLDVAEILRDHGGAHPADGLVMNMPCAHASLLPTRAAGQSTGTLVSRLERGASRAWLTGTSSPCLSVLKPVPLGGAPVDTGPAPGPERPDDHSLFWRHERLHRAVMERYDVRRARIEPDRAALEREALTATTPEAASAVWTRHREALPGWLEAARGISAWPGGSMLGWRWRSWWEGLGG